MLTLRRGVGGLVAVLLVGGLASAQITDARAEAAAVRAAAAAEAKLASEKAEAFSAALTGAAIPMQLDGKNISLSITRLRWQPERVTRDESDPVTRNQPIVDQPVTIGMIQEGSLSVTSGKILGEDLLRCGSQNIAITWNSVPPSWNFYVRQEEFPSFIDVRRSNKFVVSCSGEVKKGFFARQEHFAVLAMAFDIPASGGAFSGRYLGYKCWAGVNTSNFNRNMPGSALEQGCTLEDEGTISFTLPLAEAKVAIEKATTSDTQRVSDNRTAAYQGDAAAQYSLGAAYSTGQGVPQDDVAAAEWYRKAAEQGHVTAQYNLGVAYFRGQGVPQDAVQGAEWSRTAADQGDAAAQYNLGFAYAMGQGVPQDDVEAVSWYRKAAGQGHAAAEFKLGMAYYTGEGVPQDAVQGVEWTRKAAEQGQVDAQFILGFSYYVGQGVPQDYVEAHKWHIVATSRASEEEKMSWEASSFEMREYAVSSNLFMRSDSQIAEAQKLARDWLTAFEQRGGT